MVEKLISFSLKKNRARFRLLVWLGIYSVQENPIDAIPDLSENQVIVFYGVVKPAGDRRSGNLPFSF
jgi:Cu(I)/Ag(I) efflux system membrane protein CusA/SilA